MKHKGKNGKIFEEDEMNLMAINRRWTPEDLFAQRGIFFLKDVVKILDLDPLKVKRKAKELETKGRDPWLVMGARKVWNHWIVRMKLFAPFYRKHLVSKVRPIDVTWDGNILLRQRGIFYLTDVCKLIPFSTHQLRYQAKRNPKAREEYGIWKDSELNVFLVEMERFAPWIHRLWEGQYRKS